MLLVMHTAEIKGVFVSFHKNTVKQNIALTHLQRHTPLTKGALISCVLPLRGSLQAWQLTLTQANIHTH